LFKIGGSIPYALYARRKNGETTARIVRHAHGRTLSLPVIGDLMANNGRLNAELTGMERDL